MICSSEFFYNLGKRCIFAQLGYDNVGLSMDKYILPLETVGIPMSFLFLSASLCSQYIWSSLSCNDNKDYFKSGSVLESVIYVSRNVKMVSLKICTYLQIQIYTYHSRGWPRGWISRPCTFPWEPTRFTLHVSRFDSPIIYISWRWTNYKYRVLRKKCFFY